MKLEHLRIIVKGGEKSTFPCYQTCYTNLTEGTISGSVWKNQQSPAVFLHNAKMLQYWLVVRHYACLRSTPTNNQGDRHCTRYNMKLKEANTW